MNGTQKLSATRSQVPVPASPSAITPAWLTRFRNSPTTSAIAAVRRRCSRRQTTAAAAAAVRSGPGLASLRVIPELAEVEHHTRLVANDLGIVPRRDRCHIARPYFGLSPIVHEDLHPARDAVAEV